MEDSTDFIKPMKLIRCEKDSGFHLHGRIASSTKTIPTRPYSLLTGPRRVCARKSKPGSCKVRVKKQYPLEEIEDSTDFSIPFFGFSITRKTPINDDTDSATACSGIYPKRKQGEFYGFDDVMNETYINLDTISECFFGDYLGDKFLNEFNPYHRYWGFENSVSDDFLALKELGTSLDATAASCLKVKKPRMEVSTDPKLCDEILNWGIKEMTSERDNGDFSAFLISDDLLTTEVAEFARFSSCSWGLDEELSKNGSF